MTVQPGEEKAQKDLVNVYKYLTGGCKEDRTRLFQACDKIRVNGHTLKHKRFPLNISKQIFTVRMPEHWHRVPWEAVESPSLGTLKNCLDMVLGNSSRWPCLSRRSELDDLKRYLPTSVIL